MVNNGSLNTKQNMTDEQKKEANKKREKTNIKKFGVKNSFQNDEIKEKIKQIHLEKRGVDHPSKDPSVVEKQKLGKIQSVYQLTPEIEHIYKNKDKDSFIKLVDSLNLNPPTRISISKSLNVSYTAIVNLLNYLDIGDMYYSPSNSSYDEQEMIMFLESIGVNDIETQNTNLLKSSQYHNVKRTIDIVSHKHKIAIEMDGVYFHSEKAGDTPKNYHLNKTEELEEQGYQLLHVFSNEWYDPTKKEIWKSIIKSKFGLLEHKIHARKCNVNNNLKATDVRQFLDENHLAGFSSAQQHIGLFYNNELVSVLSVGKSRFNKSEYEIVRYACKINTSIPGGLSKLLKYINDDYKQNLISYADRRYSGTNCSYNKFSSEITKTKPNWWGFNHPSKLQHRLSF